MKSNTFIVVTFLLFALSLAQNTQPSPSASNSYPYADVVLVIDQFIDTEELINWVTTELSVHEDLLTRFNMGGSNDRVNHYGLVMFGGGPAPQNILIQGQSFVSPDIMMQYLRSALTPSPGCHRQQPNHDGYSAIKVALTYPWRPEALHRIHFVSNRWRQIIDRTITRNVLISELQRLNVIFSAIVQTGFCIDKTQPQHPPYSPQQTIYPLGLVFINKQSTAYYTEDLVYNSNADSQVKTKTDIGRIVGEYSSFTTIDDYVELIREMAEDCNSQNAHIGAAYDIHYALTNNTSFKNAFMMANTLMLTTATQNNSGQLPTGNCPFARGTYVVVGNNLYQRHPIIRTLADARRGCEENGGELANINSGNVNTLSNLLGPEEAVWINSWELNTYQGAPLALMNHGIHIRTNSSDTLPALCEISHVPNGCF